MKTPPFFLGVTLLFWGWQTGQELLGILLALFLEGFRWVVFRLDWGGAEYRRLWDATAVLMVGTAVFCYSVWPASEALLALLQWLPLLFLALVAGQVYGRDEGMRWDTFIWILRRDADSVAASRKINVVYPYGAVCLLSASAVDRPNPWYYVGLCLVVAWALWWNRPRRSRPMVMAGLLVLVSLAGYQGHLKLRYWHSLLEQKTNEWIALFRQHEFDDLTSHTSMGSIGELKQSGRLVLQLKPVRPAVPPERLRVASFNQLHVTTWLSTRREYRRILPEAGGSWELQPGRFGSNTLGLTLVMSRSQGLLPLPAGTIHLRELEVLEMEKTQYGAVRVLRLDPFLSYEAQFGDGTDLWEQEPTPSDLSIPPDEKAAIMEVVERLGIHSGMPRSEVFARLGKFFEGEFRYEYYGTRKMVQPRESPIMVASGREAGPISYFLLRDKAGHCEHFASATVLLLRGAGWPARYATGYAVQWESGREGIYDIRERDAHAWGLVWHGGGWHDLDTTPGNWADLEAARLGWWGHWKDGWSRTWFRFSWWKATARMGWIVYSLLWPLGLLVVWGMMKLWRRRREQPGASPSGPALTVQEGPGADSDFFRIEEYLEGQGWTRGRGKTLRRWLGEVRRQGGIEGREAGMEALLDLHYRYRFDPKGLGEGDRKRLNQGVKDWLGAMK